MPDKPKKKSNNKSAKVQIQLAIEYEQNVEEIPTQELPPESARELARELVSSYIKLKSIINLEVFYDKSSLGIAIVDPIAISNVQSDLKKTILNPGLIIQVNLIKHYYFRGNPSKFQIAIVVYKDDIWFIEDFIFDSTLELAKSKFKEGKIIYPKAN